MKKQQLKSEKKAASSNKAEKPAKQGDQASKIKRAKSAFIIFSAERRTTVKGAVLIRCLQSSIYAVSLTLQCMNILKTILCGGVLCMPLSSLLLLNQSV